jgi:hypothetical protein
LTRKGQIDDYFPGPFSRLATHLHQIPSFSLAAAPAVKLASWPGNFDNQRDVDHRPKTKTKQSIGDNAEILILYIEPMIVAPNLDLVDRGYLMTTLQAILASCFFFIAQLSHNCVK